MPLKRLHFGALTLDLARLRLVGPAGPIDLRPKSFDVLRYLIDHAGRVVAKGEIIAAVWPDVVVTDESLTRCISEIRHALGDKDQSLIRTVQRRGYVFDGRVTVSDGTPPDSNSARVISQTVEGRGEGNGPNAFEHHAGTKRQATILYANFGKSVGEVSERDSEQALVVHESILIGLIDVCSRLGGDVTSISEDCIVALFGAISACEDHAAEACHAAAELRLAMQQSLLADTPQLRISIGIASGEVIVRSLAQLGRADAILAIGPATYLAKRLSIEANGSTLLSSSTQDRILGLFHTKERFLPEGGVAHELVGIAHVRTRFQAMAARGLTPFVGRNRELNQLKQAADRAHSGHGQVVAIIGDAGVGKSRLIHEFIQANQSDSRLILVAGALFHRAPTSFQTFSDLIKAYLQITTGDDAAARQGKAANAAAALRSDEILDLFACLSLIDEPVTDSVWVSLEPALRRDRILGLGKKLLLHAARRQSIIVVLEDLHWLDADTQEILNSFLDSIALLPVFIVVTYRPEYSHKWHGKSYYTQLHLDELSEDKRHELLIHLTGSDATLADCLPLLQRQGNPLFLEELVRSLVDEQILEGRRGAYRLVRPINNDFRVPAAVQTVLSARIDRLPPRERLVLQAASVIGDHVSAHILRSLVQLSQKELAEALSELQAAEFLYEDKSSTDLIFRFKHALTQSVAYESQLKEQRCLLHKTIVSSIEAVYFDRLLEHVEQLAHHAICGEMGIVAVRYALQAGTKAFARFANREAVSHYEDALTALEKLPNSREKQEYTVDICCDLRNALYPLAEYPKIEIYLREAERIASDLGDQQRLGWVSAYLSSLYLTVGRSAVEARALATRAANIAKVCGNSKLLVAAQYYLTWAGYISGDYERTERICRRLMRSLQGARIRERFGVVFPAIQSRVYCSIALAEQGEFGKAHFLARDAVRLAEEFDHPFSLSWSCLAFGQVMSIEGKLDEASSGLERGLEECVLWKIDAQAPIIRARLGYVRALSDRVAEGVLLLEQALQEYEKTGMEHFLSISIVQLGEAYLIAKRVDDARSCADRALNLAKRRGECGFEVWALRLLGGVAIAEGRNYDEAQSHYDDALAKASQLRMRPLIAHCHAGLCNLNEEIGKADAAKRHGLAAYALYSDLNMPFWSKRFDNTRGWDPSNNAPVREELRPAG